MSLKHDSQKKYRKNKSKYKIDSPEDYDRMEIELAKAMIRKPTETIVGTVRIIAGKLKGFKLNIPPGTRPVTDRLKTQVFDILRDDSQDLAILDLFAGTGSFGIEAISRGAKSLILVDAGKKAEKILNASITKLGILTEATVVREKAYEYVVKASDANKEFGLIFMDPPYKLFNSKNFHKMEGVINKAKNLLPGFKNWDTKEFKGVIVIKHPTEYPIDQLNLYNLKIAHQSKLGKNTATMFIVAGKLIN